MNFFGFEKILKEKFHKVEYNLINSILFCDPNKVIFLNGPPKNINYF
jgi:hypothetical protein